MLKNKNCAQSIINIYIQIYMNKSLLLADNVERLFLGCIYKRQQNTLHVFSDIDCSNRIYQLSIICRNFSKIFPIMLALCLMLSVTYYAQNYAGIISRSLLTIFCGWIISNRLDYLLD